jgi:hypothetical protein
MLTTIIGTRISHAREPYRSFLRLPDRRHGRLRNRKLGAVMVVFKIWKARRRNKFDGTRTDDTWMRKGWFLFGFIPLYVADVENREKF